jgi:two-component system NtrC family sensor kinase
VVAKERVRFRDRKLIKKGFSYLQDVRVPISTKLILSFLVTITLTSAVFLFVGIQLIDKRVVAQAQEKVKHDINAAREIYQGEMRHLTDVVQLTANRFFLKEAIESGDPNMIVDELIQVREREGLDILTMTDENGIVLVRSNNPTVTGDDVSEDNLIEVVLIRKQPYAASHIVSREELLKESDVLAEQARFTLIDTPLARERPETEVTSGMMLEAAAPILNADGELIGVLFGGVLLNRNYQIVDTIKQTVYEDLIYDNKDIGTATIFQDDVRISTNVRNEDGSRAIGTRVSEDVYNQVVRSGQPWIGRAYVVNDWYITAYQPIRDIYNKIIGILYVGVLEQKYVDIRQQTVLIFLGIMLLGIFGASALAYVLSRRIYGPIERLAYASQEITSGNLDVRVEHPSNDELGDLAERFNKMASTLQERDKQLKEYAQTKIMESERLALVGQLAANVAHELNNPLQGIVTYSHLLLEKLPEDNSPIAPSLQRVVTQANRCRDIIRGLLDFSRQRKPDKTIVDLNSVLNECVRLVENQSIFHNIEIKQDFDSDLPRIILDPSQLQQVILNLIINAAEAMEDGGVLTISTEHIPTDHAVKVSVSDSGCGIPEENMDKLFDPFFTTKEVGHGTGLGLAISYGIIREHGGYLEVDSEVGKGTTFTVYLPMQIEEEA